MGPSPLQWYLPECIYMPPWSHTDTLYISSYLDYFYLLSSTKTVTEKGYIRTHQDYILNQLHVIYQTVTVTTRDEALVCQLTFFQKQGVYLGIEDWFRIMSIHI